ncbi:HK97 gp10 family phage protein, partial [Acinetobacter baumannii]
MFKKGNFGRLRARLEALSEVPEKVAATTLRDCAYKVKETAINMTPIDEGDLRRSIKVRRIGGGTNKLGQFSRGQSRWEVYVNMSQPT